MRRTFLTLSVLALTLTACAEPSEQAATDPTEFAWVLESGTLNGEPVPMVDTHPITLAFEEDQGGGTSACNQYFGDYTISGAELSFGDIGQTMMACTPDEVMDSESRYLEALGLVDTFSATADTLTLTGEGVELVFAVDDSAQS